MIFAQEAFELAYKDALPLLTEHYKEIAHFQDIALKPDLKKYLLIEQNGMLRTYTARDVNGLLVGYQVFFINKNAHYADSLQANEDVLFITKPARGFGRTFMAFAEECLRRDGVQLVMRHVKVAHDYGVMLERMGYEHVDKIFAKRLDK